MLRRQVPGKVGFDFECDGDAVPGSIDGAEGGESQGSKVPHSIRHARGEQLRSRLFDRIPIR
jgi:hypothetical protein